MKFDSKKIAASAMAVTMIMSMTGCSLLGGGKAKREVLDAADSFASNVCSLKASKVTGAMADLDDDQIEEIEFGFSCINDDAIFSAIASTLAYEIDEDSVEVDSKKGEASVDVVFTYVDAESVYEDVIDDNGSEEDFIDALGDCDDVVEVEVTLEFTLDDDEWLVDDAKLKTFEKIFAFMGYEFEFGADFMEVYNGHSWWMADSDDNYSNASYIDFWGTYNSYDLTEDPELYFTVEHDGVLVYTSDITSSADCYFYASDYTGDDYLPEGTYTITLYLADGTVVDSDSTYVSLTTSGSSSGTPVVSGEMVALWESGINDYWYSYSDGTGYAMDSGVYDTTESTIEYTCQVYDEDTFADFPVYYEVYYSATGNTEDAELVYSSTIYPTEYSNGYFYEFQYNGALEEGSYFFAGATDSSADEVFFIVEATVS
ncbi:MAG: hypothetical protein MJ094_00810 [Saccharofermentans sp.]|nr:hypothetical protein [Saccharofermentans sp.]